MNPEMERLAQDILRDPKKRAEAEAALVHMAWSIGDLSYKLDPTQKRIKDDIERKWAVPITPAVSREVSEEDLLKSIPPTWFFLLCARGFGKSVLFCTMGVECALKHKDRQIIYAAPTKDEAAKIGSIIMKMFVLNDAPEEFRPDYDEHKKVLKFKNGSVLEFKGVNNDHADNLRGPGAHLAIMDECGTMDRLLYITQSIIDPMLERWDGRMLLATTPAETPDHESTDLYRSMHEDGLAVKYTILQNERRTWMQKAKALRGGAGKMGERAEDIPKILAGQMRPKTTDVLREYFCEFVVDAHRAVLPEWLEYEKDLLVSVNGTDPTQRPVKRPEYFDAYEALDPGIVNKSALLFGYYDFERGVIVVQTEKFLRGADANFNGIADAVEANELTLYGPEKWAGGRRQPTRRVIDPDTRLEMDLRTERQISFEHAQKHDSDGGIRLIRTLITGKQLEIDASCKILLGQMQMAIWNKNATDFATEKDGGHYDGLAALKYLVRAVDRNKNPFPEGHRVPQRGADTWRRPEKQNLGVLPSTPWGRKVAAHWKMRGK